jgi:hypothetical protein
MNRNIHLLRNKFDGFGVVKPLNLVLNLLRHQLNSTAADGRLIAGLVRGRDNSRLSGLDLDVN